MSDRPIVVALDDYEHALRKAADWSAVESQAELRVHHAPLTGAELLRAIEPADALLLMRDRTPLPAELVERLPRLRLVVFTGTRNVALDSAALARRGIPVCHTGWGPSKESTCELAWTLILAAAKRLPDALQGLREGRWREAPARREAPAQRETAAAGRAPLPRQADGGKAAGRGGVPGSMLHGERLGLVGLGEIGGRMARVGRAFGMEVVTWSPRMTAERAAAEGATAVALDELAATSKVVSLHLVMTEATRHLFDAARFARMRPDAIFVNTSRAGLADEAALADALHAGRPGAAALDVYAAEPLAEDHPLRSAPHALLSPHLGFVSQPVLERFYRDAAETLSAWLAGETLPRRLA